MPYYSEHRKFIRSSCLDCSCFDGCNRCQEINQNVLVIPILGCSTGDRYQIIVEMDEEELLG